MSPISVDSDKAAIQMIEEFQCPGCVCGSDTKCGSFELNSDYGYKCERHVVGTSMLGGSPFCLGMPAGFNKVGPISREHPGLIRFWTDDSEDLWNKFNVPVWAMEHEGHLFVRTFLPRTNITYIDVIKGGTMKLLKDFPAVVDVSEFVDEID